MFDFIEQHCADSPQSLKIEATYASRERAKARDLQLISDQLTTPSIEKNPTLQGDKRGQRPEWPNNQTIQFCHGHLHYKFTAPSYNMITHHPNSSHTQKNEKAISHITIQNSTITAPIIPPPIKLPQIVLK
ncbi:hypothetical protein [Burkholderia sp. PU8-34]